MPTARRRRPRRPLRATISVTLVLAMAGMMFAANAQLARRSGSERHPENLAQLVQVRSDNVASLTASVAQLSAQVTKLSSQSDVVLPTLPKKLQEATDVAAASTPVEGSGLTVTLRDATDSEIPPGAVADDLVVHQQDVQAVVNALWHGGAEAMTIQGERVSNLTAVRCVGNVLFLHGQVFSPPYVISAIGDPAALQRAVDEDMTIKIYREYVAAYGLGWSVSQDQSITAPAADGTALLRQATVPQGTDVFG